MLLVLLLGPMLQIHDYFNDAHAADHDAVLHTIDALLCIATMLMLGCLLLWLVKAFRLLGYLPEQWRNCIPIPPTLLLSPSFERPPLALRI